MRIAVFSDTHGDLSRIPLIRDRIGDVDAVFHLGDYAGDGLEIGKMLGVPCYAVHGNCDMTVDDIPYERVEETDGCRFLLTHGNRFRTLTELGLAAEELHCDAVLFGHTHEPLLTAYGPILIANPGSLNRPRSGKNAGFALITTEKDGPKIKLVSLTR